MQDKKDSTSVAFMYYVVCTFTHMLVHYVVCTFTHMLVHYVVCTFTHVLVHYDEQIFVQFKVNRNFSLNCV